MAPIDKYWRFSARTIQLFALNSNSQTIPGDEKQNHTMSIHMFLGELEHRRYPHVPQERVPSAEEWPMSFARFFMFWMPRFREFLDGAYKYFQGAHLAACWA